jgi:hypothetical protein
VKRAAALAIGLACVAALGGCGHGSDLATQEGPLAFDPDSIPDAYARPSAALMAAGATRGYEITPEGNLYNGEWKVRVRASADGVEAPAPKRIAYLERWMPVAAWKRASGDVTWRFEAVAFQPPVAGDTGLVVSLLVSALNRGTAPHAVALSLELAPPDSNPVFVAWDAPEVPSPPLTWGTRSTRDTIDGWTPGPASGASDRVEMTLAPGQTLMRHVLLPAYPMSAGALAGLGAITHAQRVTEARHEWTSALAKGTRFELSDPDVEDALRAALVLLLSCRERRGLRWVPIGGPFHYRDVWLRDGARLIAALSVAGFNQEARDLAAGFLAFQWPQGAFLSQRGQLDGTGQALWAFEQAFLRPSPADSVARYADAALAAWKWLEWQRDFGRQSGWRFGLMMPYGEPRDGELTRAQLVGNDAWSLAGYRAAARLLRAAGRDNDARAVEETRAHYLADFDAALRAARSPDVPPSFQGVGRDWGNLAVGWPCGALPPGDPRLAALAARVWRVTGGPGLVTYGHADSLHGYVGADLGTWALLAGRRADADRVLESLLHWRNASGAGAELFSRDGAFGRNLPPHPTSAAALVALIRNALIFDDADTLELTLGARDRWWKGARVSHAPTRWGSIDLMFLRDAASARWHWSSVPVWTSLTLPPGVELATPPPAPLVARSSIVVLAPPRTTDAKVAVRPARGMP